MKAIKLLSLIAVLAFCSCEKEYKCTITTPGLANPNYYTFTGTSKEMKEFENSGVMGQTIECK